MHACTYGCELLLLIESILQNCARFLQELACIPDLARMIPYVVILLICKIRKFKILEEILQSMQVAIFLDFCKKKSKKLHVISNGKSVAVVIVAVTVVVERMINMVCMHYPYVS